LPTPQSTAPASATLRGPIRSWSLPPASAPSPRKKIATENAHVVVELDQPKEQISGWVYKLHE
jgi:hypothetical protein